MNFYTNWGKKFFDDAPDDVTLNIPITLVSLRIIVSSFYLFMSFPINRSSGNKFGKNNIFDDVACQICQIFDYPI